MTASGGSARRVRKAAAIAGSAAFHAALLTLASYSASVATLEVGGDAGGDSEGAVTVALVRSSSLNEPRVKAVTYEARVADRLDSLLQKYRADQPAGPTAEPPARPTGDAAELFEQIADARSRGPSDPAADAVWAQIARCWRPAAPFDVTLAFAIDAEGRLAGPPQAVRQDGGPPSPRRLLAEANAIEAIARCAPYLRVARETGARQFKFLFRRRS